MFRLRLDSPSVPFGVILESDDPFLTNPMRELNGIFPRKRLLASRNSAGTDPMVLRALASKSSRRTPCFPILFCLLSFFLFVFWALQGNSTPLTWTNQYRTQPLTVQPPPSPSVFDQHQFDSFLAIFCHERNCSSTLEEVQQFQDPFQVAQYYRSILRKLEIQRVQNYAQTKYPNVDFSKYHIIWDVQSWPCTGFETEVVNFLTGLAFLVYSGNLGLVIPQASSFCEGYDEDVLRILYQAQTNANRIKQQHQQQKHQLDLYIVHKMPPDWPSFPCKTCDLDDRPRFIVGRSMIEATPLSNPFSTSIQRMLYATPAVDELWLPSQHNVRVFLGQQDPVEIEQEQREQQQKQQEQQQKQQQSSKMELVLQQLNYKKKQKKKKKQQAIQQAIQQQLQKKIHVVGEAVDNTLFHPLITEAIITTTGTATTTTSQTTTGTTTKKKTMIKTWTQLEQQFFQQFKQRQLKQQQAQQQAQQQQAQQPFQQQEEVVCSYRYFSNFKWEPRKAPELLLQAFVELFWVDKQQQEEPEQEQDTQGKPCLILNTYLPFIETSHELTTQQVLFVVVSVLLKQQYQVEKQHVVVTFDNGTTTETTSLELLFSLLRTQQQELLFEIMQHIVVVVEKTTTDKMPLLYANADAFVLASRGEGWGLPVVEAMAMAKPVITTRYSGMLEFAVRKKDKRQKQQLPQQQEKQQDKQPQQQQISQQEEQQQDDDELVYFVEVDGLQPALNGKGATIYEPRQRYASVNINSLKQQLWFVYTHQQQAEQKGKQAHDYIEANHCLSCVGERVIDEFARILKKLDK